MAKIMSTFKSKKEMALALLDGKIVIIDGKRACYNKYCNPPFKLDYGDLCDSWGKWESATLAPEWYCNITKPVPCWVSDEDGDTFDRIDLISSYKKSEGYCFIGKSNWKYATPMKEHEVYENFED